MKQVIIGFSRPIKFSFHAWLIEKIDNAPFDHAYLRFHSDSLNRDIVYQSNWRGVEFIGASLWSSSTTPVQEYVINVSDDNYTQLMQYCIDNAGVSYGYMGTIGEGIVDIAAKFGWKISNPFSSTTTQFCSQIVTNCLDIVDPTQFNLSAPNVSPNDLNQYVQKLNLQRIL